MTRAATLVVLLSLAAHGCGDDGGGGTGGEASAQTPTQRICARFAAKASELQCANAFSIAQCEQAYGHAADCPNALAPCAPCIEFDDSANWSCAAGDIHYEWAGGQCETACIPAITTCP